MSRLLTHYTVEELNKLNNYEDYDFLEQMDLKRPFHMNLLAFRINGEYKRVILVKENKSSATFLVDGLKVIAKYNTRIGSYMIGKSCLQELTDEQIKEYNYINSLSGIDRIKYVCGK